MFWECKILVNDEVYEFTYFGSSETTQNEVATKFLSLHPECVGKRIRFKEIKRA